MNNRKRMHPGFPALGKSGRVAFFAYFRNASARASTLPMKITIAIG